MYLPLTPLPLFQPHREKNKHHAPHHHAHYIPLLTSKLILVLTWASSAFRLVSYHFSGSLAGAVATSTTGVVSGVAGGSASRCSARRTT